MRNRLVYKFLRQKLPDRSLPVMVYLLAVLARSKRIEFNAKTRTVRLDLSPQTPFASQARLRIELPAKISAVGSYHPQESFTSERDAFTIPLHNEVTRVELFQPK